MKDIRVPGLAWAILIIAIVAGVHGNEAWITTNTPFTPFWIDLALGMLIGILKGIDLTDTQLEQALDVIDKLLTRNRIVEETRPKEGMRSAAPPASLPQITPGEIPARPNKVVRFLFG